MLTMCLFFFYLVLTERALEENTSRQVRNSNTITIQQGPSLRHDPADLVVIYNRVPKTGSTSFTGIAYDLCSVNKYNVIHINTTRNIHTMSIPDQVSWLKQIAYINEKVVDPAMFGGVRTVMETQLVYLWIRQQHRLNSYL